MEPAGDKRARPGKSTESGIKLDPAPADIRAEVEKILSSAQFVRCERLSRCLLFAVEEMIAGRAHQIKEYALGIEVFDRSDSFDPRMENIVRVEARRLRSALTEYYATVGRDDPLWIEFP